jgi:hypothetical protein
MHWEQAELPLSPPVVSLTFGAPNFTQQNAMIFFKPNTHNANQGANTALRNILFRRFMLLPLATLHWTNIATLRKI